MPELNFNADDHPVAEEQAIDDSKSTDHPGYTEEEHIIIREWAPNSMGVNSSFLNKIIESQDDVLAHARACMKWEEEQTVGIELKKTEAYKQYLADCRTRKEQIELAKITWKDAIAQRKKVLVEWDHFVAAKRKEYNDIKGSLPPPSPT